ncbi:carotenoid oxygenase family protein [Plectonema radiosum NIES-515]|uniref:Carotenoid oxygenase family protein n=1 Tax=Plectonema radiosum NIES-515 TaxID=2986073 RepID=A0ABT3B6E8_9CYAN|nr:carotenoid oxygenase family protein [Plectonema radiosum]MCV3216474.1 carotenoid oxygenase family protein [Plectonema radiosum NIES-515]
MQNKLFPTWAEAITQPATEFGLTPLRVITGAIPTGLRGSLYYNGPARLERGGRRAGHWFDGDGAVLGVHFTDTGATGVYRYVQTAGYQAEEKAGKFLFETYGMTPRVPIWKQLGARPKNCANISVMALPDKLLALWEGGLPHALDLVNLKTFGLDNLGGLADSGAYAAHPKLDPQTQAIYNFGVTYGVKAVLHIYQCDRTGQIQQQAEIELDGLPLIHDFVLAGNYLVFFIPPVRLNPVPYLARMACFGDSLQWQKEQGTQIIVIDKTTLKVVSRSTESSWFQWHFANGYTDASGCAVVHLVRYEDFQSNQFNKEVATGQTRTIAKGRLWKVRLNPQSGKVIEMHQLLDRSCAFPSVPPHRVGQESRFTYLLMHRSGVDIGQELYGAIARFDHQTKTLIEADFGENRYPMKAIYAVDAENPEKGWVLTVVFDGNSCSSSVWIFEQEHLDAEPVCRLALPSVVSFGFGGTWKSASVANTF